MPLFSIPLKVNYYGIQASSFQASGSKILPSIDRMTTQDPEGLDDELKINRNRKVQALHAKSSMERIREVLPKIELSVSSYDTAWVAMVPSPKFPDIPCFPECVQWIVNSQQPDGSWGICYHHHSLMKDVLSSTLACVLALKRWNIGDKQVGRGLKFLASNVSYTMDEKLLSPIGFDIIFPGMIEYAMDMGLNLPLSQTDVDVLLHKREMELKRGSENHFKGKKAYFAYVAEGLGKVQNWEEVMMHQRANGSLFNSPSATAAALIHRQDDKALNYLTSLLEKFGNSVPTVYPLDTYTHLCRVDNLEKLGIARHFSNEIKIILDEIYRCWKQNDEQIFSDIATCAMAFRLLRMNGYDISSDAFAQFTEEYFNSSVQGHLRDINTVLQLYKASQIRIEDERILEKISFWCKDFLKRELTMNAVNECQVISQEVDYTLKFPFYANFERLEHKRNIEHYNVQNFWTLKTSYNFHDIHDKDFLELAIEEFNYSQSIYRKELENLESWVKENKLDQLKFARQKLTYCYLSAAATIFSPELSDARMSWAKNGVLTTVVDDFFDIGGSMEELLNFTTLVEKWGEIDESKFCSEQVKIVYSALYSTINEIGMKASALQQRNVTNHIVDVWLSLLKAMLEESEWLSNKSVPSIDEYMKNGYVSFALGPIILPALYFVGPKLGEDVIIDPEYHALYKLVSTCGRLLNDMQGFEREGKEGKLNSVSLRIFHSGSSTSDEDVKSATSSVIDASRTELLKLVLREGTAVPRACKNLFWKMNRILHLFYMNTDGFSSPKEMVSAVNAVIHEPLKIAHLYTESSCE